MPFSLRRRLPRDRAFWLVTLACLAIVAGLAAPTIMQCGRGGGRIVCEWAFNHVGSTSDWRYFAESWEALRVTLADFHQFPSWNPYHCGGIVLYTDAQAPFPGPMFLLTFWWLPTGAAIKIWIIAHLLAGAFGARALVKDSGGNAAEQILGVVLVVGCGFVTAHTGGGHLAFTPFLYMPLIIWAFRRSLVDARYAILLAAIFALTFYEGAPLPVPMMAAVLGIEAVARLSSPRERRRMALVLPTFGVLFVLLAGARLVPVLLQLREHPRLMPLDDQMTLGEVFRAWTLRGYTRPFPPHIYVWDEYMDYVGLVPVAIMLIGVAVAFLRRDEETRARRIDVAVLAVVIWAALGNIPGASLYGLLHELPVFASLRVPSRFLGPAMVAFALVAVSTLKTARQVVAEQRLRPAVVKTLGALEILLVVAVAIDICAENAPRIQQGMDPALPRTRASADFYQSTATSYDTFPTFPVRGIGTRVCVGPTGKRAAPGMVDGPGPQQRVEPASAGTVTLRRWTPNAVELTARLSAPATVVINQNYETGWQASAGQIGLFRASDSAFVARPARGFRGTPPTGLLAVALPAGEHALTVRHRPPGLLLGTLLALLGLALSVVAFRVLNPARVARIAARLDRWLRQPPRPPPPSSSEL